MNERQKLNKIIHNYVEVNKNEDYTNYKGLITALIEWKNEQLTLTDVVSTCCDEVPSDSYYLGTTCSKCNKPFRIEIR